MLVAVLSVVLGGALGAWMDIDAALNRLGARAQAAFAGGGGKSGADGAGGGSRFAEGVRLGEPAVLRGRDGGGGIAAKRADGRAQHAVCQGADRRRVRRWCSPRRWALGVLLSAAAVLLYQGAITLLASLLAPVLSDAAVAEMDVRRGRC